MKIKNLNIAEILKSKTTRLRKDSNFSHVCILRVSLSCLPAILLCFFLQKKLDWYPLMTNLRLLLLNLGLHLDKRVLINS